MWLSPSYDVFGSADATDENKSRSNDGRTRLLCDAARFKDAAFIMKAEVKVPSHGPLLCPKNTNAYKFNYNVRKLKTRFCPKTITDEHSFGCAHIYDGMGPCPAGSVHQSRRKLQFTCYT